MPQPSGGPEPAQQPIIFLIEDDDATRGSIEALLRGRGYTVRSYESCEDFLQDPGTEDGYLLLDYHFDGMSGVNLLETLRRDGRSMPTILYTGRFDTGIKRQSEAYDEVVAFLQKPLSGPMLIEALETSK